AKARCVPCIRIRELRAPGDLANVARYEHVLSPARDRRARRPIHAREHGPVWIVEAPRGELLAPRVEELEELGQHAQEPEQPIFRELARALPLDRDRERLAITIGPIEPDDLLLTEPGEERERASELKKAAREALAAHLVDVAR